MNPRRDHDERREATREGLLAAAVSLMAERGVEGSSLADIAERAGVTRGAIVHKYANREAFLDDVVERVAAHAARVAASIWDPTLAPFSRVPNALARWIAWSRKREPELRVLAGLAMLGGGDPRLGALVRQRLDAVERTLAEGLSFTFTELSVRTRVPCEALARALLNDALGAALQCGQAPDGADALRLWQLCVMAAVDPVVIDTPDGSHGDGS